MTVVVLLLERRSILKEKVNQVEVATPCGKQKRGVSIQISFVKREPFLQQPLHEVEMATTRRLQERRVVL